MSTTSSCRREEVALCQPDRTILVEQNAQMPPKASENVSPHVESHAESGEKQTMSEKQFMRDHSLYSAMSSWLFAIAGATNIGVLGVLSSKILHAAEKGLPLFKSSDPAITPVLGNKKFNYIALAMTAFGGLCMAVSNWLESKKVVTEWQLGAGKLQRKVHIAEHDAAAQAASVAQPQVDDKPAAPSQTGDWGGGNWVATVQSKTANAAAVNSGRLRHD